MHVLTLLRMYLGRSQLSLAKAAHITQPDLSEMESIEPYGRIGKYRRVADVLGIPIEPILKNDINEVPLSFFEKNPPPPYLPEPKAKGALIGRQGEDFIFARERERLSRVLPVHAHLVLPLYKMKAQRIGCDLISFDDDGTPTFLEVKTSVDADEQFVITKNELELAQKLTADGARYKIILIQNWGTEKMFVEDTLFSDFLAGHNITAHRYSCSPKRERTAPMSGFAYYRRLRGLKEREIAEELGISRDKWSLYETGYCEPSVKVFVQASELLGATVDELLATYPAEAV